MKTGEITKQQPGTRIMATGLVILALGFALLLVNLTSPVTNYVAGHGMVQTANPSAGSIIMIIAGALLAAIGFGKRLLAAAESR